MAANTIDRRFAELKDLSKDFCIIDDGDRVQHITYPDLFFASHQLQAQLENQGVKSGDGVAIAFTDPWEFSIYWFTLLRMNVVVVPIDPLAPDEEKLRWAKRARARIVLDGEKPIQFLADFMRYREGGVIFMTSGTTGDPKPVGLSIPDLIAGSERIAGSHQFTRDDVGYSPLPLFHVNAEVVALLTTFMVGSTIVLSPKFSARHFWTIARRHRVNWINAVPTILTILLRHPVALPFETQARIRFIRSASAPLPSPVLHAIQETFGIPVLESYGMSEAGSQITINDLNQRVPGSVGKAYNLSVRIVNSSGQEAKVGEVGEIRIQGPGIINPQWGPNAWVTEKLDKAGWYSTGDLGMWDRDRNLWIKGRVRDIINRGGETLFPREIEDVIAKHPQVVECAVVKRAHDILGEEAVAFVVLTRPIDSFGEQINPWMQARLSNAKRPSQFITVKTLPKGRTGKILRPQLEEWANEGSLIS